MDISREYFSMLDYSTSRLIEFILECRKEDGFLSKEQESYPGLQCDSGCWPDHVMMFDVIRCMNGLSNPCDVTRKEGLGVFMLMMKHSEKAKSAVIYDIIDQSIEVSKAAVSDYIRKVQGQIATLPNDSGFLMEPVLNAVNPDLLKRYYVLLYRFCSVVAKADGVIDETESRYLADLLKASEESGKTEVPGEISRCMADTHFDVQRSNVDDAPTGEMAMKELDSLIGLAQVKEDIHTLTNFAKVCQMRREKGLKTTPLSLHCVFTGNPGTGKTTVARILGQIYKQLGLCKTGKLVETDRSGLVASYVGQTAAKTNKVIDSALGGVLFIDEAYSLIVKDSNEDYGKEAVATLLKRMEDDRDRLIVILAGYTDQMEEFLQSNPGLNSRFGRRIRFDDYSAEELRDIFLMNLRKYEYTITDEASTLLSEKISKVFDNKPADFGNARFVRNIFEKVLQYQANRVAFLPSVSTEMLSTIEKDDIELL